MVDLKAIRRRAVNPTQVFPGCVVIPSEDFTSLCEEVELLQGAWEFLAAHPECDLVAAADVAIEPCDGPPVIARIENDDAVTLRIDGLDCPLAAVEIGGVRYVPETEVERLQSGYKPVLDALEFAHGLIRDGCFSEDGLDPIAGRSILGMIEEQLTKHGRAFTSYIVDDDAPVT